MEKEDSADKADNWIRMTLDRIWSFTACRLCIHLLEAVGIALLLGVVYIGYGLGLTGLRIPRGTSNIRVNMDDGEVKVLEITKLDLSDGRSSTFECVMGGRRMREKFGRMRGVAPAAGKSKSLPQLFLKTCSDGRQYGLLMNSYRFQDELQTQKIFE